MVSQKCAVFIGPPCRYNYYLNHIFQLPGARQEAGQIYQQNKSTNKAVNDEKRCCLHLAESLSIENDSIVTLGAVLHTSSDLPPPSGSTFYAVADRGTGTGAAASVTRLATAQRTQTSSTLMNGQLPTNISE